MAILHGNQDDNLLKAGKQSLVKYRKIGDKEYFKDYNEYGQIVQEKEYYNSILSKSINHTYDSNRNLLNSATERFSRSGNAQYKTKKELITYDSFGNKINFVSEIYNADQDINGSEEQNWIYDSDGNILSDVYIEYDADKNHTKRIERLYTYDHNFKMLSSKYIRSYENGNVDFFYEYNLTYDSDGNMLSRSYTQYGPSTNIPDYSTTTNWTYDSDGNKLSSLFVKYNADKSVDHSTRFDWTYDTDGNMLKERFSCYNSSGNLTYSSEKYWTYDSDGNILTLTTEKGYKWTYTYDSDGNKLSTFQEKYHNGSFKPDFKANSTYDSEGNTLSEISESYNISTGEVSSSYEKYWTYDSEGNILIQKSIRSTGGSGDYSNVTTYTYDSKGNKLSQTSENYNKLVFKTNWTYDSNYNMLSQITTNYNTDGSVKHSSEYHYTYDSDGNILTDSYKKYDPNGVITNESGTSYMPTVYDVLNGMSGDDTLVGTDADEVFIGGQGNDLLQGGTGNDNYLYKLTHGYDVIEDSGGFDKLVFGENIAKQDIEFVKEDNDLLISFNNRRGQVTISDWYVDNKSKIEAMGFHDGSSLNLLQIESLACLDNLVAGDYFKDTSIDTNAIEYIKSRIADYDGSDFDECVAKLKSLNEQQKDNLVNSMKKAVKEGVFSEIEPMLDDGKLQSVIADMSAYGTKSGIGLNDVKEYVDDTEMMNMIMPYLS